MKRQIFILFLFLTGFQARINAQCATPAPTPPAWIFEKSENIARTAQSYTFNLFIHIIRSSSGNGLSASITNEILAKLNNTFRTAGIQFQLVGYDYIDNDANYKAISTAGSEIFSQKVHSNAFDLYLTGINTTWPGTTGRAESILSSALIIHGSRYNTNVLIHEMGHCLGLYHTHHGTAHEDGDSHQCKELVNGSNGDTCGDYIRDTPADPNLWIGCISSWAHDENQEEYHPDPSNYMSYADYDCMNKFTPLQLQRMKNSIANTPVLQRARQYTIAGPSTFCEPANYSIPDLPTNATVSWTLNPTGGAPYPTLRQNGNTCTVTNTYNAQTTVTLKANIQIGGITLPAISQTIRSNTNDSKQTGTYQQESCNFYGVTHPALSGNLTGEAIFVHQGCRVTVNLQHMEGKTCTAETNPSLSGTPTFWTYQGNTHQLLFELPYGAGSVPFRFHITGDGMCQPKSLLFFAISDNKSAYSLTAEALPGSNQCTIRIEAGDKQARNIPFYHVSVFDLLRGTKAIDFEMRTDEYTFDTYGWPEGSYVVFARIGTETVSQKIIIKP